MSRCYRAQLPRAEARHLAGVGPARYAALAEEPDPRP